MIKERDMYLDYCKLQPKVYEKHDKFSAPNLRRESPHSTKPSLCPKNYIFIPTSSLVQSPGFISRTVSPPSVFEEACFRRLEFSCR